MAKNFRVQTFGRKYIDLPGTNNTRGLNSVPLTMPDEFDIKVLYSHKQAILGGVGSNDKCVNDTSMYELFADENDDEPLDGIPVIDVHDAEAAATVPVQV